MVVSDGSACSLALSILCDLLGGAGGLEDLRRTGEAGGVGVDMRSGCSNGMTSAAGPISDRRIGKKKSPLRRPIPTRQISTTKK